MITKIPTIAEIHGTRLSFMPAESAYQRVWKQRRGGVGALGTPWTDNSIGVSAPERRHR
jgi:hypothetical protein